MNIINDFDYLIDTNTIDEYLNYLNEQMKINKEYTIVFVDDDYIQKLNKEFRNKNQITDVLTFVENIDDYLGDIIISYPQAKRQANEYNHSLKREILFLITHGFLHLLGYDHKSEQQEKEMFSIQTNLLDKYGIRR